MRLVLHTALLALILFPSLAGVGVKGQSTGRDSDDHPKDATAQNDLKKKRKEEKKLCSWYEANYRYLGYLKALKVPKPEYPEEARRAGITGSVIVALRIGAEGHVEFAAACEGPKLLRDTAVQAAYKAEFSPLVFRGKAVGFLAAWTYTFNKPL